MVILHAIVRVKSHYIEKFLAQCLTLNIHKLFMGLSHFVKVLGMDPKQYTGRHDLNNGLSTVTEGFGVSSMLCGI